MKKSKLPPARIGKKREPRCGLCGKAMERGANVEKFSHSECIDGEPISHVSCMNSHEARRRRSAEQRVRQLGFKPTYKYNGR